MQNTEAQQFLLNLIEQANNGKLTEFRFLMTLSEYFYYKGQRRFYNILLKTLRRAAARILQKYCIAITQGSADFLQLLAYKQILQVIEFYQKELDVINDMLQEYEAYLWAGHCLDALIGESRGIEDLRDFRGD